MTTQAEINRDAEEYQRKFGHIIPPGHTWANFLKAASGDAGPWTLPLDAKTRAAVENASEDLREDFPGQPGRLLQRDDEYRS